MRVCVYIYISIVYHMVPRWFTKLWYVFGFHLGELLTWEAKKKPLARPRMICRCPQLRSRYHQSKWLSVENNATVYLFLCCHCNRTDVRMKLRCNFPSVKEMIEATPTRSKAYCGGVASSMTLRLIFWRHPGWKVQTAQCRNDCRSFEPLAFLSKLYGI